MTEHAAHIHVGRTRWHFVRHLVEMMIAMHVGMAVGAVLFAAAVGTGVTAARQGHAVAYVLVMALAMTAPMVAVMLYRGHTRRSALEMAAVMIAPALPLVALKLGHVVTGPISGAYMCTSMLAMIALIVYRRGDYLIAAAAHA
jgi:hypothetical protein